MTCLDCDPCDHFFGRVIHLPIPAYVSPILGSEPQRSPGATESRLVIFEAPAAPIPPVESGRCHGIVFGELLSIDRRW